MKRITFEELDALLAEMTWAEDAVSDYLLCGCDECRATYADLHPDTKES